MEKNRSSFTIQIHFFLLLLVGVLLLVVGVSCRPAEELSTPTVQQTPTSDLQDQSPGPAAGEETDVAASTEEVQEVDQCLVCHADQQTLMDTADPVVVVESENSGEG